jgi:hypothetical protein
MLGILRNIINLLSLGILRKLGMLGILESLGILGNALVSSKAWKE